MSPTAAEKKELGSPAGAAQHTPGPWTLTGPYLPPHAVGPVLYLNGPDGTPVATIHLSHRNGEANASLLVASLDLKEALLLVAKGLRSGHIKDQTLIDTKSDGPEARMFTLSSAVFGALRKAATPVDEATLQSRRPSAAEPPQS